MNERTHLSSESESPPSLAEDSSVPEASVLLELESLSSSCCGGGSTADAANSVAGSEAPDAAGASLEAPDAVEVAGASLEAPDAIEVAGAGCSGIVRGKWRIRC